MEQELTAETVPPFYKQILGDIKSCGHTEAVILGGALRDLHNCVEVKDIDIFLSAATTPDVNKTVEAIEHQLHESFVRLGKTVPIEQGYNFNITDIDSVWSGTVWNTDKCVGELVQLIFLKDMFTPTSVMDRIDMGICKIAYDGISVHMHDDYNHDVVNKRFTIRNPKDMKQSIKRYLRISDRYPDWPLFDADGKDITPEVADWLF